MNYGDNLMKIGQTTAEISNPLNIQLLPCIFYNFLFPFGTQRKITKNNNNNNNKKKKCMEIGLCSIAHISAKICSIFVTFLP